MAETNKTVKASVNILIRIMVKLNHINLLINKDIYFEGLFKCRK